MRQLGAFVNTQKIMTMIKQWSYVFGAGLLLGVSVGTFTTYWSIIKDCQVMGMFRYGDAPMSCTYHLINVPVYNEPKEVKKK